MFTRRLGCFCVLLGFSTVALASDFYIYPKNNQDAQQQQQDDNECYVWARNQTGFDPMAAPTATSAPPPQAESGADGTMARGALRGAALGGIVGGSSDDAWKGAAAGALVGGFRKRDRQKQQEQQQEQYQQDQAAQYQQQRNSYDRAYKGCMEARNYSLT